MRLQQKAMSAEYTEVGQEEDRQHRESLKIAIHQQPGEDFVSFCRRNGFDPERTYFDLPRCRAHRLATLDYGCELFVQAASRYLVRRHPTQLINYWVPVYESEPSTVMSMFIDYFSQPIPNASGSWDYDESVREHALRRGSERRCRKPSTSSADTKPGRSARRASSAKRRRSDVVLHLPTPQERTNLTNPYSYDLRTLHIDDLLEGRGPENIRTRQGDRVDVDRSCAV